MKWYFKALNKYAEFSGRASRTEFWMFLLFHFIIFFAISFIEGFVGMFPQTEYAVLAILYGLGVAVPYLAIVVRRLHDTGRSGWCVLFGLIPVIGSIVLLVLFAQDSHPGENQYGPNPKLLNAARSVAVAQYPEETLSTPVEEMSSIGYSGLINSGPEVVLPSKEEIIGKERKDTYAGEKTSMFCTECGKKLEPHHKFCGNCGHTNPHHDTPSTSSA